MPRSEFSATNLNHLRRQLNVWRRSQPGRTRLPEEVWESATSLACRHGVSSVARTLRLDYYKLRRRSKPRAPSTLRAAGFVELPSPALPLLSGSACTVELSDQRGGKMTVHLPDQGPALLTMAQAFWQRQR